MLTAEDGMCSAFVIGTKVFFVVPLGRAHIYSSTKLCWFVVTVVISARGNVIGQISYTEEEWPK